MPPPKHQHTGQSSNPVLALVSKSLAYVQRPESFVPVSAAILLLELVLTTAIITFVPYTEIDWKAYMDEVEGAINGTYDYTMLKGDTGPLVYPAGFVYVFGALYYATDLGSNIERGQYIFAAFYLALLVIVFAIYKRTKVSPLNLALITLTAYRVHSIFVLRLFNDPVAMLFLYASVVLFLSRKWSLGSLCYSFAVSIKMNVLLFAPGLLLVYLLELGVTKTITQLSLCAGVQLVLAVPFLLENPVGYLARAFDLGRQFMYKWTVNWKMLPEETFLDRRLHIALLALHLLSLGIFLTGMLRPFGGWRGLVSGLVERRQRALTTNQVLLFLFGCNVIGMVFARSLHYQFYVWYYHMNPLLMSLADVPLVAKVAFALALEYAWNVYPATAVSSSVLLFCHCVLFFVVQRLAWTSAGRSGATKQE